MLKSTKEQTQSCRAEQKKRIGQISRRFVADFFFALVKERRRLTALELLISQSKSIQTSSRWLDLTLELH